MSVRFSLMLILLGPISVLTGCGSGSTMPGEGGSSSSSSASSSSSSSSSSNSSSSSSSGITHACAGSVDDAYQQAVVTLPATVQAENFDVEGFSDSTAENEGGAYRTDTAVDIKTITGGHAVGWMMSGEYLEYTVDVASEGDYDVILRAGAVSAGRTLAISQCGATLLANAQVPFVHEWGNYITAKVGQVRLQPGLQKLRIIVGDADLMDLDWIHLGDYDGELDKPLQIAFGTKLDPIAQMQASRQFAEANVNPNSSQWRAKGDQRRTYFLPEANTNVPFRVVVPNSWDGQSALPLVMFLHGAGNNESSYLDQNNQQMVKLAQQHNVVLVSPLGYNGAYGNLIRLPAVFGEQQEAEKMLATITQQRLATEEISEKDVINVLELVMAEYPINRDSLFLTGHSMGSGGTWLIGGKYATYWAAIAPMSGPFVQEQGYPWNNLNTMPIFITEGTQATPSLMGSRDLRDWLQTRDFDVTYSEVSADHAGMVPLVLPEVFNFFKQQVP